MLGMDWSECMRTIEEIKKDLDEIESLHAEQTRAYLRTKCRLGQIRQEYREAIRGERKNNE